MKKILIICPLSSIQPNVINVGGVDAVCQSLFSQITKLDESEYHIRFLAFDPLNKVVDEGRLIKVGKYAEVVQFNCNSKIFGFRVPGLLYQNWCVRKTTETFKPDLIHSHQLSWCILPPTTKKQLVTIHSYRKIARRRLGMINNFVNEWLVPALAVRNIAEATVVSSKYKDLIAEELGVKVTVVPNPISDLFTESRPTQDDASAAEIICITCGFVTPRKNMVGVVKCFNSINQKIPSAKLYIAGGVVDLEYKKELDELIKVLELEKNVTFLGAVAPVDLALLYQRASYGIFLSKEETFGLAPLEMIAAGLRTVVSNVGVISEIDGDLRSLGVIISDDPGQDEVSKLIDSSNCNGIASQYIYDHFSVPSILRLYLDIYTRILNCD